MNDRDLMEAKLREKRGLVRTLPPPETHGTPPADGEDDLRETVTEQEETIDRLIELNLKRLLRKATDEKAKQMTLKIAVAYVAVKNRATPIFGEGLDDEEES